MRPETHHKFKTFYRTFYRSRNPYLLVVYRARERAKSKAEKLLGSNIVTFAVLDGTEYTNRMFDIVAFFGGSYAAKGTIDLSRNPPIVEYSKSLLREGLGVSSYVPRYVNQIVEVEQSYLDIMKPHLLTVFTGQKGTKMIVNKCVDFNQYLGSYNLRLMPVFFLALHSCRINDDEIHDNARG